MPSGRCGQCANVVIACRTKPKQAGHIALCEHSFHSGVATCALCQFNALCKDKPGESGSCEGRRGKWPKERPVLWQAFLLLHPDHPKAAHAHKTAQSEQEFLAVLAGAFTAAGVDEPQSRAVTAAQATWALRQRLLPASPLASDQPRLLDMLHQVIALAQATPASVGATEASGGSGPTDQAGSATAPSRGSAHNGMTRSRSLTTSENHATATSAGQLQPGSASPASQLPRTPADWFRIGAAALVNAYGQSGAQPQPPPPTVHPAAPVALGTRCVITHGSGQLLYGSTGAADAGPGTSSGQPASTQYGGASHAHGSFAPPATAGQLQPGMLMPGHMHGAPTPPVLAACGPDPGDGYADILLDCDDLMLCEGVDGAAVQLDQQQELQALLQLLEEDSDEEGQDDLDMLLQASAGTLMADAPQEAGSRKRAGFWSYGGAEKKMHAEPAISALARANVAAADEVALAELAEDDVAGDAELAEREEGMAASLMMRNEKEEAASEAAKSKKQAAHVTKAKFDPRVRTAAAAPPGGAAPSSSALPMPMPKPAVPASGGPGMLFGTFGAAFGRGRAAAAPPPPPPQAPAPAMAPAFAPAAAPAVAPAAAPAFSFAAASAFAPAAAPAFNPAAAQASAPTTAAPAPMPQTELAGARMSAAVARSHAAQVAAAPARRLSLQSAAPNEADASLVRRTSGQDGAAAQPDTSASAEASPFAAVGLLMPASVQSMTVDEVEEEATGRMHPDAAASAQATNSAALAAAPAPAAPGMAALAAPVAVPVAAQAAPEPLSAPLTAMFAAPAPASAPVLHAASRQRLSAAGGAELGVGGGEGVAATGLAAGGPSPPARGRPARDALAVPRVPPPSGRLLTPTASTAEGPTRKRLRTFGVEATFQFASPADAAAASTALQIELSQLLGAAGGSSDSGVTSQSSMRQGSVIVSMDLLCRGPQPLTSEGLGDALDRLVCSPSRLQCRGPVSLQVGGHAVVTQGDAVLQRRSAAPSIPGTVTHAGHDAPGLEGLVPPRYHLPGVLPVVRALGGACAILPPATTTLTLELSGSGLAAPGAEVVVRQAWGGEHCMPSLQDVNADGSTARVVLQFSGAPAATSAPTCTAEQQHASPFSTRRDALSPSPGLYWLSVQLQGWVSPALPVLLLDPADTSVANALSTVRTSPLTLIKLGALLTRSRPEVYRSCFPDAPDTWVAQWAREWAVLAAARLYARARAAGTAQAADRHSQPHARPETEAGGAPRPPGAAVDDAETPKPQKKLGLLRRLSTKLGRLFSLGSPRSSLLSQRLPGASLTGADGGGASSAHVGSAGATLSARLPAAGTASAPIATQLQSARPGTSGTLPGTAADPLTTRPARGSSGSVGAGLADGLLPVVSWAGVEELCSFGTWRAGPVHLATWQGRAVVLHDLTSLRAEHVSSLRVTLTAVAALRHPGLGRTYAVLEEPGRRALMSKHYPGGSLADLLSRPASDYPSWPLRARLHAALQVAEALAALHTRGPVPLVHGELTTACVHLTGSDPGGSADAPRVVVTGAGLAVAVPQDATSAHGGADTSAAVLDARRAAATPPEVLLGANSGGAVTGGSAGQPSVPTNGARGTASPCTAAGDVWAYGIVLLELVLGRGVYGNATAMQIYRTVMAGQGPDIPAGLPRELTALLAACLSHDPGARPSCADVVRRMHTLVASAAERTTGPHPAGSSERARGSDDQEAKQWPETEPLVPSRASGRFGQTALGKYNTDV